MEVDVQMVIVAALYIHFENPLGGLGEQGFLQSLQGAAAAGFLPQQTALVQTAATDGGRGVFLRGQTFLFRLVAEQIHPQGPMLQLLTDGAEQAHFDFRFVFDCHLGSSFLHIGSGSCIHYSTGLLRIQVRIFRTARKKVLDKRTVM